MRTVGLYRPRERRESLALGLTRASSAESQATSERTEATPYTTSQEHLWDELQRIDQLIRAQTLRWRQTIGASTTANLWGMVHVTDAEVETYLRAPFSRPRKLPAELEQWLTEHWNNAHALEQSIADRLAQTPSRTILRLDKLRSLFGLSASERDALLVCLLPELDARYRRLFG